jgi:hypothetical protein
MICGKCGTHIRNPSNAHVWEEGPVSTYLCHECYQEENDYYEEPSENSIVTPKPERTFKVTLYRDITQKVDFYIKDTDVTSAVQKARDKCNDIDDGSVVGERLIRVYFPKEFAEVVD